MLSVLEITEWNEIFSKGFKILQGEKKLNVKNRDKIKKMQTLFFTFYVCVTTRMHT